MRQYEDKFQDEKQTTFSMDIDLINHFGRDKARSSGTRLEEVRGAEVEFKTKHVDEHGNGSRDGVQVGDGVHEGAVEALRLDVKAHKRQRYKHVNRSVSGRRLRRWLVAFTSAGATAGTQTEARSRYVYTLNNSRSSLASA